MASSSIYDLDYVELTALFSQWDEPSYRVLQVWKALYCNLISGVEQLSTLPKSLRQRLGESFCFSPLAFETSIESKDRLTRKDLFRLADGEAVETVLMNYTDRRSLCISTQCGCAMGCVFCATGKMGWHRNLSPGEIVGQVIHFQRTLVEQGSRLTNIVIMGMGEPFQNYVAVIKALKILSHPQGLNFGSRRLTVSTVGLVPQIRQFTREDRQWNLSVSLHAADDGLRSRLVPENRKYPLRELMDACKGYCEATHRRITYEYALIRGVNDSLEQAKKLVEILPPRLSHVNLILLNPVEGIALEPADAAQAASFKDVLERGGIRATIRLRRGIEIQAGCGQLASKAANHPVT